MNTKPILLWPKPRSDIEVQLGQSGDDFLVVDTNYAYELRKLYNIHRTTPILDPFPRHGVHYRDFSDHVVAGDCGVHIVGLELCKKVLQALNDPKLSRSSIEELLATIAPAGGHAEATGGTLARFLPSRQTTTLVDWSSLNWLNTALAALLVFVAALAGNVLFFDNSLMAAAVAALLFVALYVGVRIGAPSSNRAAPANEAWFDTKRLRSSRS
jgi:hypothetical protein